MRISNIMEHRGSAPYVPKGFKDGDKKKKKKNERPVMLLRGARGARGSQADRVAHGLIVWLTGDSWPRPACGA